MPVHQISNGDTGIAEYTGASTWRPFRELYICETSGMPSTYVQLSQLWRCANVNNVTGVYDWQQFAVMDKYRPTVSPQNVSQSMSGNKPGANITVSWTEAPGTGVNYELNVNCYNQTQGTNTLFQYPVGRNQSFATIHQPTAWNSGDQIHTTLWYNDQGSGYTGPVVTCPSDVILP